MGDSVRIDVQSKTSVHRKILLIDHDSLVLNYLRAFLEIDSCISVSMAKSLEEAAILLRDCHFDLVFSEFYLKDTDFLSLMETCNTLNPQGQVVTFTSSTNVKDAAIALGAGSRGYVVKTTDHLDLLNVVNIVLEGGIVVSSCISVDLFGKTKSKDFTKPKWFRVSADLTHTEMVVLEYLCRGLSNHEIAYSCGCSVATVKKHISTLLMAFNVESRLKLVCKVVEVCEGIPSFSYK